MTHFKRQSWHSLQLGTLLGRCSECHVILPPLQPRAFVGDSLQELYFLALVLLAPSEKAMTLIPKVMSAILTFYFHFETVVASMWINGCRMSLQRSLSCWSNGIEEIALCLIDRHIPLEMRSVFISSEVFHSNII